MGSLGFLAIETAFAVFFVAITTPVSNADATFDWREDGFTVRYYGQEKEILYAECMKLA